MVPGTGNSRSFLVAVIVEESASVFPTSCSTDFLSSSPRAAERLLCCGNWVLFHSPRIEEWIHPVAWATLIHGWGWRQKLSPRHPECPPPNVGLISGTPRSPIPFPRVWKTLDTPTLSLLQFLSYFGSNFQLPYGIFFSLKLAVRSSIDPRLNKHVSMNQSIFQRLREVHGLSRTRGIVLIIGESKPRRDQRLWVCK